MRIAALGAQLATLALLPIVVVGVINRVKARWAGRLGPPILQLGFDLARLVRKRAVYSATTTGVFQLAPWLGLAAALFAALIVPITVAPALSFRLDFVAFAYAWGLGRVALMLGALDTGSAFEGMGASREATFGALLEPALFMAAVALCADTGTASLAGGLADRPHDPASSILWIVCIAALLIVVTVETARMPVDDPTTHLELTMIHEVMVLDHSGPDLAVIQYTAALKLTCGLALVANLIDPVPASAGEAAQGAGVVAMIGALAILIGCVESMIARLKLRVIPQYIAIALGAGVIALLATAWQLGGLR